MSCFDRWLEWLLWLTFKWEFLSNSHWRYFLSIILQVPQRGLRVATETVRVQSCLRFAWHASQSLSTSRAQSTCIRCHVIPRVRILTLEDTDRAHTFNALHIKQMCLSYTVAYLLQHCCITFELSLTSIKSTSFYFRHPQQIRIFRPPFNHLEQ